MSKQLKPTTKFADEAAERAFWEAHDSADYLDWTEAERVVLANLKPTANARDVPYQSLIKVWLQEKLHSH